MFRACASKLQVPSLLSMQQSRISTHDIRTPYTPKELQEFRIIFRGLPSYDPKSQSIKTTDYALMIKGLGLDRTKEQVENYMRFQNRLGGTLNMGDIMRYATTVHDSKMFVQEFFLAFDLDNDGFISKEEYDIVVETLAIHDPDVKLGDYKKFVAEADSNKDGKVSMDEFRAWLSK